MAYPLSNWTEEFCSTTGGGDLILTGASAEDQARFRDGLQSGEVFYSIHDGTSREAGIGIFNGTNRITRNNVHSTLVNGVYKTTSPAPLTLSGQAIISGTYNARTYYQVIDDIAQLRTEVDNNTTDITQLKVDVDLLEQNESTLEPRVTVNEADIAQNAADIALLDGGNSILEPRVAQNEVDIAANQANIAANTTNINTNTSNVANNTSSISTNTANIATNTTAISDNTTLINTIDGDVSFRETAVTALESGGELTQFGDTTVAIAAGSGELIDSYTDTENQTVSDITWAQTNFDLLANAGMPVVTGIGITWLVMDSTGTPKALPNEVSSAQRRTHIVLGYIEYLNQVITNIAFAPIVSNQAGNTLYDLLDYTEFSDRIKGLLLRPTEVGDMTVWRDSGTLFQPGINYSTNKADQNVAQITARGSVTTPIDFKMVTYSNGTTGVGLDVTQVPTDVYEEGGSGIVGALPNGTATVLYFFQTLSNADYICYGQKAYATYDEAVSNLFSDRADFKFPIEMEDMILLAQIVVFKNAVTWDAITAGIYPLGSATSSGSGGGSSTQAVNISYTDTYTIGTNVQSAIDSLAVIKLTTDQYNAVNGAAAPDATNVFATIADITGGSIPDHNDTTAIQGGAIGDYQHLTLADVNKLGAIPSDANNYVHPTHSGLDTSVATGALTGAQVVSQVDIVVTTDTLGHVTNTTGTTGTRTLTLADLGYTGDTDATNDQTKAEIDALGIDADTVDGIHGTDVYHKNNSIDSSYYKQAADISKSSGTHTIDFSLGDMQQITATGGFALAFSNFPAAGVVTMVLDAVNWGSYTITYPAGVVFSGGAAPAYTSIGTDRLLLMKDKDEVYSIFVIGENIS